MVPISAHSQRTRGAAAGVGRSRTDDSRAEIVCLTRRCRCYCCACSRCGCPNEESLMLRVIESKSCGSSFHTPGGSPLLPNVSLTCIRSQRTSICSCLVFVVMFCWCYVFVRVCCVACCCLIRLFVNRKEPRSRCESGRTSHDAALLSAPA